jgi:hypothetical protein
MGVTELLEQTVWTLLLTGLSQHIAQFEGG